jgi:hypothetical protein
LLSRPPNPDSIVIGDEKSPVTLAAESPNLKALAEDLAPALVPDVSEEAAAGDVSPVKGAVALIPKRAFAAEVLVVNNGFDPGLHERRNVAKERDPHGIRFREFDVKARMID